MTAMAVLLCGAALRLVLPTRHVTFAAAVADGSWSRRGRLPGLEPVTEVVQLGDSTQVAYATVGEGPPLVYVAGWLTHLELSWAFPPERRYFEQLARGRTLVRYDKPGCGLSGPCDRPPSVELELEALGAVVAAIGGGPVELVGASFGAQIALRWAAAHPDQVAKLVLYGGWARGEDLAEPAVREHLVGLVRAHWGLGSDVLAEIFGPDASASARAAFVRYQREASPPERAAASLALSYEGDVTALLGDIVVPTLVVHRADDRAAPLAEGERLAAGISGAQLQVLPGRSHLPYLGDADAVAAAIRRFLGLRAVRPSALPVLTPRQREVAALVAEGCSNRDLATQLGITERSAEGHVERIRLRLGFRSRSQIAAWYVATEDPPPDPTLG
jgi:pimeloyl-ACP methyl ester carboxylesterase/DNA-binding CsgD family transcriptional regulator